MATLPLEVSTEEATIATDVAADTIQVLKATAIDENTSALVADLLPGFDDVASDITGVEKMVKAIGIGAARLHSRILDSATPDATPNTLVKRDAEGDFAGREVTVERLIFEDASFLTTSDDLSRVGHTHTFA